MRTSTVIVLDSPLPHRVLPLVRAAAGEAGQSAWRMSASRDCQALWRRRAEAEREVSGGYVALGR